MMCMLSVTAYATTHNIGSYETMGADTFGTEIMNTIKNCGTAVGAIIIALAVVKLIVSLADENVAGRVSASMMLGAGIFFAGMTTFLTTILGEDGKISSTDTANGVAKLVIDMLGQLAGYASIALLGIAAVSMVLAFLNEDASAKARGTNTMMAAFGFSVAKGGLGTIQGIIGTTDDPAAKAKTAVVSNIEQVAKMIGACLVAYGMFQMFTSFRNEDSKGMSEAAKLIAVGLVLVSVGTVLSAFGL